MASPKNSEVPTTAEQARCPAGHLLDGWGLPVNALRRADALAELDMPDPDLEPEAWEGKTVATIGKPAKAAKVGKPVANAKLPAAKSPTTPPVPDASAATDAANDADVTKELSDAG